MSDGAQPFDVEAYLAKWSRDGALRMHAYYYGFEPTGAVEIDRVLSAVAIAGKRYHHTDEWAEDWTPPAPIEAIQAAASLGAEQVKRMRVALGEDASGRPLDELLMVAANLLDAGPLADCLRLKAEQVREAT